MNFEIALQDAIYDALTGSSPLMAMIKGLYDSVPQPTDSGAGAEFPYVTYGEASHTDWSTDTESGDDATITIHTWSRYRGRTETKQIQGVVYDALHRVELTVTGFAFVAIDWLGSDSFVDADGLTRHGVQTFRVLIDQQ